MIFLIVILAVEGLLPKVLWADYTIYYDFISIADTAEMTYATPEPYILFRAGDTSYFYNHNLYMNDSLIDDFEERIGPAQDHIERFETQVMAVGRRFLSTLRVQKLFGQGTAKVVYPQLGNAKFMEVPLDLEWNILNEFDTIRGLRCNKALTSYGGRKYIAWFTESIPISDGPYIFNGLPGLIVKVVDLDNWYTFEVVSVITTPAKRILVPGFINEHFQTRLTREEFVNGSIDIKTNPKFPPGVRNVTPEMNLNLRNNYKKRFDLLLEKSDP